MEIIDKPIRKENYFNTTHKKDTIVLHHTVSSNTNSPYTWFNRRENAKKKTGAAFVIGKDSGEIYQMFDPKYSAYHTGTGNKNNIDFRSIGIEIVNEGYLDKLGVDYYWLDGKAKYHEDIFTAQEPFRGKGYFAKYTQAQYDSVNFVIEHLLKLFPNIEPTFSNSLEYDSKYFYNDSGIISHVNLRKTGKWDLSPAYNLDSINKLLRSYKTDYVLDVEMKDIIKQ